MRVVLDMLSSARSWLQMSDILCMGSRYGFGRRWHIGFGKHQCVGRTKNYNH